MVFNTVYCTVNTDASFDPHSKTGGYGIWIRCEDYLKRFSAKFKEEVNDSNECEIKAVINALTLLKQDLVMFGVLVINCDNQTVIDIINKKKVPQKFYKEGEILINLLQSFGRKYYAKHVKGHQKSVNSARQYINNWVDKESRNYKNQ